MIFSAAPYTFFSENFRGFYLYDVYGIAADNEYAYIDEDEAAEVEFNHDDFRPAGPVDIAREINKLDEWDWVLLEVLLDMASLADPEFIPDINLFEDIEEAHYKAAEILDINI